MQFKYLHIRYWSGQSHVDCICNNLHDIKWVDVSCRGIGSFSLVLVPATAASVTCPCRRYGALSCGRHVCINFSWWTTMKMVCKYLQSRKNDECIQRLIILSRHSNLPGWSHHSSPKKPGPQVQSRILQSPAKDHPSVLAPGTSQHFFRMAFS